MNFKSLIVLVLVGISNLSNGQSKYEFPYQDPSVPVDQRVEDIVSRMTLEEKVFQLFNDAPAINRLDVPSYNWWNECLHGVARAGKATVFPQAIGMAATFDKDLMLQIGTAISDEARAKHHYFARNDARFIYMGLTFWTPNINIFRDPRWGRGQETYGEDPYLTGRMAVNFINGLQGSDPNHLKVIATAKHYAVHSGPESTRHIDNFAVNDRDLWETYLPAFEATVKEAHVQSVMCAYNRFRDKPCCGSDLLLSNILRNDFGFNGYIVSDCGAISDFYTKNTHHVVETPSQALGWSLAAGTDLNCEENRAYIANNYEEAVKNGVINESDINVSVKRLFKARFLLGMFDADSTNPYAQIPMTAVGSKEHLDLSLKAAEESLVLLKNNGILPLEKNKKIALIGPNANNFSVLIGNYNGDPINPVTPLKAFKELFGDDSLFYSSGCPIVPGTYTDFEIVKEGNLFHKENSKLMQGLKAEYFESDELTGEPKIVRVDNNIDFYWEKSPINQKVDESFGVRWTGILVPNQTGTYQFSTNLRLKLNGKEVNGTDVQLVKDKEYELEAILKVKAFIWGSNHGQQFAKFLWINTSRDFKKEALDAAAKADVIVFCGGISPRLEGEEMQIDIDGFAGGDRTHLNLPKIQEDLLKELHKTGKPIVYVNMSGSAVAINWEEENLPAIIQAFYPGETTGTALVQTLYGEYNPSGRLPVTFYKSVDDLPDFKDYRMDGRTYKYFKGTPLYEFGYGLSYTTFAYSNLKIGGQLSTNGEVSVSVDVTNSGKVAGDEVVQMYFKNENFPDITPIKSMIGFTRVSLNIGETKTVTLNINSKQLAMIDRNMERLVNPGKYILWVGGKQPSDDAIKTGKVLQVNLDVTGVPVLVK